MIVIGIDENGLGPALGPMVVTGAAFKIAGDVYNSDDLWKIISDTLPADDSKKIFSRNSPAKGEGAILKWASLFNLNLENTDNFLDSITFDMPLPCPDSKKFICRPETPMNIPMWTTIEKSTPHERDLQSIKDLDIMPLKALSANICPGLFNKTTEDGVNKLNLDFNLMIEFINSIYMEFPGEKIIAICGKVGGTKNYLKWFEALNLFDVEIVKEIQNESIYKTTFGTISFIKDADASHMPVAVASMLGKYVREIEMININKRLNNTGKDVSGYRDVRTKAFISETAEIRKKLEIEERCFLRTS
ncbi:MAG: hypothetical protein JXR91_06660 [Deltaproteobacteria bacterium]|nr:hypothetical protein [Deltaproteobacteria bacterium]